MRDDDETVTFTGVKCRKETEKALLCVIAGEEEWIPKSQVSDDSEVFADGHEGKLVVSHWIAKERGLI